MEKKVFARCLDCAHQDTIDFNQPACSACGSLWREAIYDYPYIRASLLSSLPSRPFNLWRYSELLPTDPPPFSFQMGEGGTPLIHAASLGSMLGMKHIYIKDERQNPTSSFKDRQAAVAIHAFKQSKVNELVCASTGNVAISYSAYAARAGIRLWAFLTSLVPPEKMREVASYGTRVIKVTGTYDQTKQLAAQFALERHITLDLGSKSIACIEAMKTLAFEICEQLALSSLPSFSTMPSLSTPWRAPDWYFQSVSGGMGPLGVIKGFRELFAMSLIQAIPKMGIVQVAGCAPMVHAWHDKKANAIPVTSPQTMIATLATGDPGRTYTELLSQMNGASGGSFCSVTDEEAYRAMHLLAKMEGISVEPAAAVAFAGLFHEVRAGTVKPDDLVVVNCTGHTLPIENHILDTATEQQVEAGVSFSDFGYEEGLLAALNNLNTIRYPRIAIVDDDPNVRRLISRILKSQGNYVLFEAVDGNSAIDLVSREKPDLVILDLMMPDVDGFSVIDQIHAQRETRDIPIIVMTAKDLTIQEKIRLQGQIQSLMRKGNFVSEKLLSEVKALIK